MKERKLLYGVPLDERGGKQVPPSGIDWCNFTDGDKGLVFVSSIFHDDGGLTYLGFDNPSKPVDVQVRGLKHSGVGELVGSKKVEDNLFVLTYNIDGASWVYEGTFNPGNPPSFTIRRTLCGLGELSGHPGYVDDDLSAADGLLPRTDDLALLTDPLLRTALGDGVLWRVH